MTNSHAPAHWLRYVPWFATALSTAALGAIAWYLIDNVLWFRTAYSSVENPSELFRIHTYHVHVALIKRSIGLFSGFALVFLGTSVMLYSLPDVSRVELGRDAAVANVTSASPGIISVFLGVVLIGWTISSKDNFPGFPSPVQTMPTMELTRPPLPEE